MFGKEELDGYNLLFKCDEEDEEGEEIAIVGSVRYWDYFDTDEDADKYMTGLSFLANCAPGVGEDGHFFMLFKNDQYEKLKEKGYGNNDEIYLIDFTGFGPYRAMGIGKDIAEAILADWCHGQCLKFTNYKSRTDDDYDE